MPFTNPNYPGQIFKSFEEFEKARKGRQEMENSIAERGEEITKVTATVIPAPEGLLERKLTVLEKKIERLERKVIVVPTKNGEGLEIGTILRGESRGDSYTLEILDEGYLCSDGRIYDSLSGAAQGVSGNRRSGWKFWKDVAGTSIGELTGRFEKNAPSDRFVPQSMP